MEPKSDKKGLRADIAKIARRCSESIKMEPEGSQKACREPAKNKQNERKSTREKSMKKQQNCIQNSGQNPTQNGGKKRSKNRIPGEGELKVRRTAVRPKTSERKPRKSKC